MLKGKIFMRRMMCLFLVVFLLGLTACQNDKATHSEDILTQKETEDGRTQITVLTKNAFTILEFEKIVEEKFPDIDLVLVGNHSKNMGILEYENRLKHGDLTDIVMTWPLEVGEEYWGDNLMDLSGMEFSNRYNISMLNDISKDGKLFYLPGPSQIRGIVYNKTLFEEKGWKVPSNFNDFISLCKNIEESGIRSLQLGFENPEVLDTALIGFNFADYFRKPQDIQFIEKYNNGVGSYGDHFSGALDTFQLMIQEGIWKEEDLKIDYAEREMMLFSRQCAMVEDSVLLARMANGTKGSTDEFALMPFFNPGGSSDWARIYMVCYIGLNKNLEEPANKNKLDLVMQLMDYISTPEGQISLASDTGGMLSSLMNADLPNVPEVANLIPTLDQGRYGIFEPLSTAQGALQEGLAGMIRGDMTKADVIRLVDERNRKEVVAEPPEVLGVAKKDFSLMETASFLTDVLQEWSKCEISLFLDNGKDGNSNGKGLTGKIYKGNITMDDIDHIMPDSRNGETCTVWRGQIKGSDLLKTLEYSVPVDNNISGWFYYFSGLKIAFDPKAEMGQRVQEISMADGKPFDVEKIYSIAVMDNSVPEKYFKNLEKTDVLIKDLWVDYIRQAGEVTPVKDDRFTIIE